MSFSEFEENDLFQKMDGYNGTSKLYSRFGQDDQEGSSNFFNMSWNQENNNFNMNQSEIITTGTDFFPDHLYNLGWGDLALVSLFCFIIAGTVVSNKTLE